jgi:hypothetical protein
MSIESWIGIIVGISTIITTSGLGVRWLVRHYFDEIKAELKPNHGSSIKDQITRLESKQQELEKKMDTQHTKLEKQIDKMFDALIDHLSSNKK